MKSVAGSLVEAIGAILIIASIAAAGPAIANIMQADSAVSGVLEFLFLAIAGVVGFALGLFLHKIEKLAGE